MTSRKEVEVKTDVHEMVEEKMGTIYLLHFEPRYRHARHYLGYTGFGNVSYRLHEHIVGRGAKLTRAAVRAGCTLMLARKWTGDRTLERALKKRHNTPKLCPICARALAQQSARELFTDC